MDEVGVVAVVEDGRVSHARTKKTATGNRDYYLYFLQDFERIFECSWVQRFSAPHLSKDPGESIRACLHGLIFPIPAFFMGIN